jgi:hypothetical protein
MARQENRLPLEPPKETLRLAKNQRLNETEHQTVNILFRHYFYPDDPDLPGSEWIPPNEERASMYRGCLPLFGHYLASRSVIRTAAQEPAVERRLP